MGKCLFLRKGETHTAPLGGILANTLAVGSTVKLIENGTAAEYLVVHQGLPSSMYDASCDGMWVLRKELYEKRAWNSVNKNDYTTSTIHAYLNGDFFNLFGEKEQVAIKQVKIPYFNGTNSVKSGSDGLDTKVFLLGGYEIGFNIGVSSEYPVDGAKLSYFRSGDTSGSAARTKRIAYLSGTATTYWTRSPVVGNSPYIHYVPDSGSRGTTFPTTSYGIRPALILPSRAVFDETTLILKGVA